MSEGGMRGLWLLLESLEELRLTLEANKSLLEKQPGTLFDSVVHSSVSREETKVAFMKENFLLFGKEES